MKGFGTINGQGDYGFLISAVDDNLNNGSGDDPFRIKIWEITSGQIFYDDQISVDDGTDPSKHISAGPIVIHKYGGLFGMH